jgi:hypothetical protein
MDEPVRVEIPTVDGRACRSRHELGEAEQVVLAIAKPGSACVDGPSDHGTT